MLGQGGLPPGYKTVQPSESKPKVYKSMKEKLFSNEVVVRVRILVYGVVQGVGFRPFVDRFAKENYLTGWVLNASSGIEIEAEGKAMDVKRFVEGFSENAPPQSLITHMEVSYFPPTIRI